MSFPDGANPANSVYAAITSPYRASHPVLAETQECAMLGRVRRWFTLGHSPTAALLLGLIVTLAAVVAYSFYVRSQIAGLQELQRDLIDRNRKDSLQLIRIQNDLNAIALAMRDML